MLSLLGWLDELSLFVGATVFDIPINEFLSGSEPYDKRYRRDEILTVVVLGIQRKFFKKNRRGKIGVFSEVCDGTCAVENSKCRCHTFLL
jgi:hypothetical protein